MAEEDPDYGDETDSPIRIYGKKPAKLKKSREEPLPDPTPQPKVQEDQRKHKKKEVVEAVV